MKKAVCIISGGMDSATCAYITKNLGYEIIALHFDYKQRTQNKEKECFERICDDLEISQRIVINTDFIAQIGGNSLTDLTMKINKDGIKENEIPNSCVSFRNGIFLSIAASIADVNNADKIVIGVVDEDSSGYPDCKEEFISSMQKSIILGTKKSIEIFAPLIHLSKADIVKKATELNVKLEHTWSCYESSDLACGECDSCRLRLKGFKLANQVDKIPYKSQEF